MMRHLREEHRRREPAASIVCCNSEHGSYLLAWSALLLLACGASKGRPLPGAGSAGSQRRQLGCGRKQQAADAPLATVPSDPHNRRRLPPPPWRPRLTRTSC